MGPGATPPYGRLAPRSAGDLDELAFGVVGEAPGELLGADGIIEESENASEQPGGWKNPAAVVLVQLDGEEGGKARAAKLTAEERGATAEETVARWNKTSDSNL